MPQILVTPTKEEPKGYVMPETLEEKILAIFKPTQPFELVGTGQVFEQDFVGYEVDRNGVIRDFYSTGFTPTTSLFDALGYGLGITPFIVGLIAGYRAPLPPEEKREKGALPTRGAPSFYNQFLKELYRDNRELNNNFREYIMQAENAIATEVENLYLERERELVDRDARNPD